MKNGYSSKQWKDHAFKFKTKTLVFLTVVKISFPRITVD
jgi:hypothetical protein